MTVLTLLVKAFNLRQLKQVDEGLRAEFENLDLDFKLLGAPVNKWVQVSLSGEDEVIATNYINNEIGTCPISIKKVEEDSVLKGYVTKIDSEEDNLVVDVGIFEPTVIQATIPSTILGTELVNGKQLGLNQICKTFGLQRNSPLSIKIIGSSLEENYLKAELSAAQVDKTRSWKDSLLDRLIVLGATRQELESVLERTRLNRDIIDVERLGFFEYALTCKLGTDATGVIPRIGRYMRNAQFAVFNSKKLYELIGKMPFSL